MKTIVTSTIRWALVLMAIARPGRAEVQAELERREPTVVEVRRAAVRFAGLDGRPGPAWIRRARLAGWVPDVTLHALRALGRDEGIKRTTTVDTEKLDLGDDLVLEARATWSLSRLVFDPVELRAAREGARQTADRLALESEVTRLYYQRRRAQVEASRDGAGDPNGDGDATRRNLEIAELTAMLDAMTGDAFSLAVEARR